MKRLAFFISPSIARVSGNAGLSRRARLSFASAVVLLGACASPAPPPSTQHLEPAAPVAGKAPDFALAPPLPKPPKPVEKPELYSVVVHETGVQDLLFALARDAKVNVSVHPAISGTVTMSVLDQTLIEILDTISKQVDMRYEMNGKSLSITPDLPFLKMYRVDYPNISRSSQSSVSISTNVASTGGGPGSSGGGGSGSNASDTTIKNTANNLFWESLVGNLRDLLKETDRVQAEGQAPAAQAVTTTTTVPVVQNASPNANRPAAASGAGAAGASANAAAGATGGGTTAAPAGGGAPSIARTANVTQPVPSAHQPVTQTTAATTQQSISGGRPGSYRETGSVIANAENGVINVRATQRQHEKVREFLDGIMGNARRQVLIEATIVEVDLSDRYQQGIDWSLIYKAGDPNSRGISITPGGPSSGQLTGGLLSSVATLSYNRSVGLSTLTSALRLLESFGTLRVLSSPKVSVLNSQTSILKVVDNEVYFTISVTPGTAATATSPATPAIYTSTINTVPIGFLMTVTPQISSHGEVILNLRPTISRISSFATDPSPALATAGVVNRIPVVQSREMESILRVQSGDIAVLGGLIQDTRDRKQDGVPGFNGVPVLGDLFKYADNRSRKTELVIFLRPTVLTDSSLDGDFQNFRSVLPDARSAFTLPADQGKPATQRP
ncbi:MAG: pilus (MSHA type) biogenesis protein MshL [Burkholderiaceae bacterium]|nr:pilus (MSHA type) biogenesis protein MshL [Sulfuritalea sp.]MCF8176504.1 pilus (MSHA type) biogenesis protein MshL [Burkholderiaceae bacterium]